MTTASEQRLLARFPKSRPALPPDFEKIYVQHYVRNRAGASPATSVAQKLESWMHRRVAEDVAETGRSVPTLEIGSGTLNHLPYEPRSAPYDVVEPFVELAADSPFRSRVRTAYLDVEEIHGIRYDRIVSIAAFEHMPDLPAVVARCALLLAGDGQLRVAIPSEGTILWTLGWKLTTGIEFRLRHHLDYGVLMRHEHLNTAREIEGVLQIFFRSMRRSVFGLVPALSLYQFFQCADPDVGRGRGYLAGRGWATPD